MLEQFCGAIDYTMGGGRRGSALKWLGGFASLTLIAAAHTAVAAELGDSRILYYEPLRLAAPAAPSAQNQKATRTRELQFDAYGRRFVVSLTPNDKLSALLQSKPDTASIQLYRGEINGAAQSWARIAVTDGQLHGMLWDGSEMYVIEPLAELKDALPDDASTNEDTTAIFRLADVVMKPGATSCATDTAATPSKGNDAYGSLLNELKRSPAIMQAAGASRRLEISALADSLFLNRYGTDAQARAEILQRLNNVDGIFSSQLGVEIQVPSIDIGDSLSDTTDSSSLLSELGALRRRSPNLYSRGLTHLFTGRDLDGTTVGIAYLDSLCNREFGAGLSEASGRRVWIESLIAAHEIGHNFGAVHDNDPDEACASTPTGFLMSASINGNDRFSTCSLGLMQPNVAAASCIAPLPSADIAVAANLGVVQRPVGRPFDWDLTVSNVGGLTTVNARAEILMPPVVMIEATNVAGGSCTSGAGLIMCQLDDIPGGGSAVIRLSLRSDVVGSNSIAVDVSADNEVRTNNNHGEGTLSIEPETDLAIGLQAPASVAVDGAFNVSLSARNLSAVDAGSVTVTVALPAGVTATSAALNGTSCSIAIGSINCAVASLAAGATVSGTASLSAGTAGSAVLLAQISSDNFDSASANNSDQATVAVTGTAATTTSQSSGGGGGGSSSMLLLSALLSLSGWRNLQRRAA